MAKLNDVTSPQVHFEPVDRHLQIDVNVVKAHAEIVCQVAEEIQVQVTGRTPGIPLDDVQLEFTLQINLSKPKRKLELSYPLSRSVICTIWVQSHYNDSIHFLHASLIHLTNIPQRNALVRSECLYRPRNVNGRGKQSLSTKILCIPQTRT